MKEPGNPLKKLGRLQLLELLARQERELELLRRTLEQREAELADRQIRMERSGSIAEAALKINKVFESAQWAADQYLLSVQKKAQPQMEEEHAE